MALLINGWYVELITLRMELSNMTGKIVARGNQFLRL